MPRNEKRWVGQVLSASGRVFSVSLFLGLRSRRLKVYAVLSLLPALVALVIQLTRVFQSDVRFTPSMIFLNVIMSFDLQFLLLLLTLFYGASIVLDEVDGRTLHYLITRPVPKPAMILGKYAASILILAVMMNVGVLLAFLILNMNRVGDLTVYAPLLRSMAVLTLGVLAYTAFFAFLGVLNRRAIFFGLLFSFGWETWAQYFPGTTQRLTIVHYIKSLLPQQTGGRFSFLLFRLEPTSPPLAIVSLLGITLFFVGLSALIFFLKDYLYED